MSSPPDADSILTRDNVANGDFANLFRQGLRGVLYAGALFVVSIFTGLVEVLQNFLGALADGVTTIFSSFFGANSEIITAGGEATAGNFLLPAPFGFVEGLLWVLAGAFVIRWAMSAFSTDIFFLPGFDLIPNIGNESDGQSNEDD